MNWKPDICIYHGGCDDGFGAAWAVWKRWPDVKFIPGYYGRDFDVNQLAGKQVLFVDFSVKHEQMLALAQAANRIVVIDHHKTAQAELAPFPQFAGQQEDLAVSISMQVAHGGPAVHVWFDMGQSGATMTWQFCHETERQDTPCPVMLTLIEDRDLWRFIFGEKTKKFSAALRTYEQNFELWDRLAVDPDDLVRQGESILRGHQKNVAAIADQSFTMSIRGYDVPCCNASYHYASDVAHELLLRFPDAPFAACWFMRGDRKLQFSLRSEDSREDVSEIAKSCGGGGHRNAAGFETPAKGWF